mgnify:FL=1
MKHISLCILLSLTLPQLSSSMFATPLNYDNTLEFESTLSPIKGLSVDSLSPKEFNKMKATAVVLTVTLGVFGVHRMYLGTSPRIPITYTLTLGGGFFVLPAIDIVYIINAKSPEQLTHNNSIFIWNKTKKSNL